MHYPYLIARQLRRRLAKLRRGCLADFCYGLSVRAHPILQKKDDCVWWVDESFRINHLRINTEAFPPRLHLQEPLVVRLLVNIQPPRPSRFVRQEVGIRGRYRHDLTGLRTLDLTLVPAELKYVGLWAAFWVVNGPEWRPGDMSLPCLDDPFALQIPCED